MGHTAIRITASEITVERKIFASPQTAWALLTDTAQWPRWGPSVRAVFCPVRHIRKGSRGRIQLPIGVTVPFFITEYIHESYWGWKVAGVPATGHRLIAYGDNVCKVGFEMPVYWLPYGVVCKAALSRIAGILET